MIALSDISSAFIRAKYTYAYGYAPIGTKLPYIVATDNGSNNFCADGKVYEPMQSLNLNFYSQQKSETSESEIEGILNGLGVNWTKDEAYDEDGSFFLTIYSFWR